MNHSLPDIARPESPVPDAEVLVRVDGVGKKFCRNLRRSLWYGVQDIAAEWLPWKTGEEGAAAPQALRLDEFWAVKDVSFELRRGECLGLIGRNGAGKTTLLKLLNGLFKPDAGRIEIRGRVGALIALGAGFNPILTGRENIYVNGAVLGMDKKAIDAKFDEIVDFAELAEFIDMPVQNYSSGMQVRLGFAVAATLEPDVLILDEVLAVGDAGFRVKCFNRISGLLGRAAVIFVSHNMAQITRICSRVSLMQRGSVLMQDDNAGAVVARYHSLQDSAESPIAQGSGKACIHAVAIQDAEGKPAARLRHGTPFSIAVRFSLASATAADKVKVLITINDEEQLNVAQILEPVEVGASGAAEHVTLRICFAEALFNMGRYSLTASILTGAAGELAAVLRSAAAFRVEHSFAGYAPILLHPAAVEVRLGAVEGTGRPA